MCTYRTVKLFVKEKLQVDRHGSHKESVALVFWKLNLAAMHEWGEWLHNHFQCILGLREGGRPSHGRIQSG